jgi:hypothetical protein
MRLVEGHPLTVLSCLALAGRKGRETVAVDGEAVTAAVVGNP